MLNRTLFFFFITVCLLFSGVANAQTHLQFQLESFPDADIRVVTGQSVLNNFAGRVLASGKIGVDGKFQCTVASDRVGLAWVFIGNTFYKLWLDKGGLLLSEKEGSLSFSGSLAGQNDFLYRGKLMQPYLNPGPLTYKKEQYKDYISSVDDLLTLRLALLEKLEKEHQISPSFAALMRIESLNTSFYDKSQYALLHKISVAEAPRGYFDFWEGFKVQGDDPFQRNYTDALKDYVNFKITQRHLGKPASRSIMIAEQFVFMDSLLRDRPLTREYVKGELLLFLIKYFDDTPLIESLAGDFASIFPNSFFREPIAKAVEARNARLRKKITFTLKDEKGEAVSPEKFAGKLVYVDFWGSWCKACLLEMPAAKKLREYFKCRDVVFLYIDFNDTKERWLEAISAQGLKDGVNLKAEKQDEAYFEEHFGIASGFPRYAVLDRKGYLVSTTVSGPGKPETIAYLEKLLKQ